MKLAPENFHLENTSIWSFPQRGNWATHDSSYRGNCSPYVARNLILRYSKENEWILDPFSGGGTFLIEAKLLNRNIIGVDVNSEAVKRCKHKTSMDYGSGEVQLWKADARNLKFISKNSIDFICTHPPYANIIRYSNNIKEDISLLDYNTFLDAMEKVAIELFRVLKSGKYCAFVMGDIRKNGFVRPLGFETMNKFINVGFKLKEIIIKEQHNCKSTKKWEKISINRNFLLLAHEYIFVFVK